MAALGQPNHLVQLLNGGAGLHGIKQSCCEIKPGIVIIFTSRPGQGILEQITCPIIFISRHSFQKIDTHNIFVSDQLDRKRVTIIVRLLKYQIIVDKFTCHRVLSGIVPFY